MTGAPTVRVTFQGGGALLAVMIPMAHAFRDAERRGWIKIDSVAGSSAGAICAALVASRIDFVRLREFTNSELETASRLLLRHYYDGIFKSGFILPNLPWAIFKIITGKPVIRRSRLLIFINTIFDNSGVDIPKDLEDFKKLNLPSLYITRSCLSQRILETLNTGNLRDAVRDSCSFPLVFSGHRDKAKSHKVDGGLCDNLPITCFESEDDLPIFAVSVSDNAVHESAQDSFLSLPTPRILSYITRLFSTSINHGVVNSKKIVGDRFVVDQVAPFEIHQVKIAVNWLKDDNYYQTVYKKCEKKIRDFSNLHLRPDDIKSEISLSGRETFRKKNIDLKKFVTMLHCSEYYEIESNTFKLSIRSVGEAVSTDIITSQAIILIKSQKF